MSFAAAAVSMGFTGMGATLAAGAMMGATTTVAGNVIGGRDPFDNLGRGIVLGGVTAGLTPGVAEAFELGMPAAAGITSFGVNTLATGDLSKGLMAGMSAYGMYGLSENMTAAGGNALVADANLLAAQQATELSGLESMSNAFGEAGANVGADAFGQATTGTATNATLPEKLSRGFDVAKANPGTFFKDNAKNLMYTATPLLADMGVKSNMPTTTTRPGAVRRFSYDPYGQLYTPIGNYEVPVKAAGGGLMGMNDGGYSPGQLDFMQRSEPVVRMAEGGAPVDSPTEFAPVGGAPVTNNMTVEDLYTQILGRQGEQAGLDYWKQGFGDTVDTNEIASFRQAAQAELANRTPEQRLQLAPNLVSNTGATSLGNVGDMNYVARDPGIITATNQYFAANPDVAAAYAVNNYGLTPEQFAQTHYTNSGQSEGRASPLTTTSNSNAYLLANPDVAAEYARNSYGMTPAELVAYHSTTYGNAEQRATPITEAQNMVANMYRNVLNRDPDPEGLAFWSNAIAAGRSPESIYKDFLTSARANTELVTADQVKNASFADATKAYKGYMSADTSNIVDEWVRTTLGREPTAADKAQQWYKDAFNSMRTVDQAKGLYGQFQTYAGAEAKTEIANRIAAIDAELRAKNLTEADLVKQTGKTKQQLASEGINLGQNLIGASQLNPLGKKTTFDLKAELKKLTPITTPQTYAPAGTTNPYGNATNPGDITRNADGTITVQPNIPGRPFGGFPGMASVRDAYTQGGGSLGYIPYAPKTMEEFEGKYNTLTGGSKEAYDYLTGKTKYSATPFTETGEVMKPYAESVLGRPLDTSTKRVLFDPVTKKYKNNPDYIPVSYTEKGKRVYGLSSKDIASQLPDLATSDYEKWMTDNNVTHAQIAEALGISLAEAKKRYAAKAVAAEANGGLMAMAGGGMAQQFDLGGYSDGGRLLRGPGDGVSDSIPATIGNKRPARLADGEFVVPARIVSELGNGSTEAGARKLYAMMDRVQAARRGSIGKGKVAKNSRADKYLPA